MILPPLHAKIGTFSLKLIGNFKESRISKAILEKRKVGLGMELSGGVLAKCTSPAPQNNKKQTKTPNLDYLYFSSGEHIAQWWTACFACARPWFLSPAPQKQKVCY
jgi:hypothetical protein